MTNKSKFKSVSLLTLVYCGLQLPAAAINYNSWVGVYDAFWWNPMNLFSTFTPIGMGEDLSAPDNSWISNASNANTVFHLNGHTLTGCGGTGTVIWNNGGNLEVNGGTILSNGSTESSIINTGWAGQIFLIDVRVDNGVHQYDPDNTISLYIGRGGDNGGQVVTLSGANNIETGTISFQGTNSTLIFDGGIISETAHVYLAGATNVFNIISGNVTLNDSALVMQNVGTPPDLVHRPLNMCALGMPCAILRPWHA